MRKLVEAPLGQLGLIADYIHFTGYLEDDDEFLSDISFYEYKDDDTEDELDKSYDVRLFKKRQDKSMPNNAKGFKLARKDAAKVRDGQKQALKKIQKRGTCRSETSDDPSVTDTDVKLDHDVCDEPYGIVRKQQKPPKKPRHGSASLDGIEVEMKTKRKGKASETSSKRRGASLLDTQFGSRSIGEKVRDLNMKEESLDAKEADAVNRKSAVQAFQRKKKLCKAVDLKSAGEKGHNGKNKGYLVETKRKKGKKGSSMGKDHSSMEGMQKIKSESYSSDSEASLKANPIQSFNQGLVKDKIPTKEEDGLVRAELRGEHRLKQEEVAGSSTTEKLQGPSQQLIPSVVRNKKKTGQATKGLCVSLETVHSEVDNQKDAVEKVCDNGVAGEEVSSGVTEGAEENKELVPDEDGNAETKVGWVMCDSCKKWRCIPASLIDKIEATNCGWFCKDNPNKKFADCSVPQEKTNIEINRELNLSEVSFCEEGDEKHPAIDSISMNDIEHQSQPRSTWTLIKDNIFQHRCRQTETIDEQMVCTCKPPEDGEVGCGENCDNRMLNIECVSQSCPCGDACSNQQFQKRLYKKVNWFRCGKKGFGLQVLEDVPKGAFIIEYVGEVLNVAAYEARQRQYTLMGQKHLYFMTLSSNEVIDACFKGNLGRFINHSCEPNCTTEKWMVNGEVCIGIFAIRDLKKGEEITFDYNLERVCGAAAKKCLCGSFDCRGYIGGDPTTPQSVILNDSDEDDPEPIMIEESSEEESRMGDSKIVTQRKWDENIEVLPLLDQSKQRKLMLSDVCKREGPAFKQAKTKTSFETSVSTTGKRLTLEMEGGLFEGVEERLNKLVDENGGLRMGQPKVATRYLKLLVETAAFNAEESRSTRDLLLVLDALLKTQSRAILLEISGTHGLQVLHRMMKQSKKDYKKIPIIRKLFKVLEFLAVRHILTTGQINSDPIRSGVESVKDTVVELCGHADPEVQQMAKHFRERFLKESSQKPLRRGQGLSSDLSKWRLFPKRKHKETSGAAAAEDENTRKRKRPSRWDQPSQEVLDTTLAGGLPQSFWPFNANNLLLAIGHQSDLLLASGHQSDLSDHRLRQTEDALADDLGARHPGPLPSVPENQCHAEAAQIGSAVVSGIPVEQFSTGSSMGYVSQQGPICIGIPVSQFHGAGAPGSDFSYMPQILTNTHQVNHPSDGQALPSSSNVADVQEPRQHEFDVESSGKADEEPKMTFGISHSQFFQQMHGMFGSAFHPWQLQCLMAPHAWGPFLAGDARIRELAFVNEAGASCRQPSEYRGPEENASKPEEPSRAVGYVQEAKAPVAGLTPLSPPHQPFACHSLSGQAAKRTDTLPYMGKDNPAGRSNTSYQQFKSSNWKTQQWNSPRWSRFQGNDNKIRNPGYQRGFNYTHRNHRQNFGRQGPIRSNDNWENSSFRKHPDRNWGYFDEQGGVDHQGSMEMGIDGEFNGPYGPPFQDSGISSGSVPLEKPWGYEHEYHSGDPGNCPGDLSQEMGNDTVNSWGVNNQ